MSTVAGLTSKGVKVIRAHVALSHVVLQIDRLLVRRLLKQLRAEKPFIMTSAYTDAAPHLALVARLETLLEPQEDVNGNAKEAEDILKALADALRDESIRELVGISSLPSVITDLVRARLGLSKSGTEGETVWYAEKVAEGIQLSALPLLLQVGRVAANLAIDNDANRRALIELGYPQTALTVLATQLPLRSDHVALNAAKSLIASLLNISYLEDPSLQQTLGSSQAVDLLLSIANGLYSPGEWSMADGIADIHARAQIAEWLWTVVTNITEAEEQVISIQPEVLIQLLPPLLAFLPSPDRTPSASSDLQILRGPDLRILRSASQLLETFTLDSPAVCKALPSLRLPLAPSLDLANQDTPDAQSVLGVLLLFIEHAEPPSFWRNPAPSDSQIMSPVSPISPAPADSSSTQPQRAKWATKVGMCKAAAIKAVTEVCAEVDMADPQLATLWPHMRRWLFGSVERDDLVACALLCFGNAAREESACLCLLKEESMASRLVELLVPSSDVKLQHALVGLLKNLAIPRTNKTILGEAGVIGGLRNMNAWSKERDLLGSVQGGAIGVVKHLCNGNADNALKTVDVALDAILALVQRTDDVAMRCEGTRVFVNAIRSLCTAAGQPGGSAKTADALGRLGQEDVVAALSLLVRTGGKYPILVNEGVVSLALLVAFSEEPIAQRVAESLTTSHVVPEHEDKAVEATAPHLAPPSTTAEVLAYILAPTPSSSSAPVITPELQQNVCTLLSNLSKRGQANEEIKQKMTQGLEAVAANGVVKVKEAAQAVLNGW